MATAKRREPEPVPAEVVEDAEFAITQFTPGGPIVANFEAVRARIAGIVEMYSGIEVTPEYLPQAKKDRAWLNSLVTSVEQKRKDIKSRYLAEYTAFEAEVKTTLAPVREASAAIDSQVKAIEEQERAAKRAECAKHYAEYAGALVDAVPFERIEDPAWSLKSTSLMAAFKAIEDRVDGIAKDDAALDSLNLEYIVDAKSEFFATLDMGRAIARNADLVARAEVARAVEEQKNANIAALAPEPEPEPEVVAAPVVESAPAPEPPAAVEIATWHIVVTCSREELDSLLASLKALGISGTVRRG